MMSTAATLGERYTEAQNLSRALGAQLAALGDRRRRVASRVVTPLADRARALLRGEPVQADLEAVEARRIELERIEQEQRVVGEAARLLGTETLEPLRGEIGYAVWQANEPELRRLVRAVLDAAVTLSGHLQAVLAFQRKLIAASVPNHEALVATARMLDVGRVGPQVGGGDYGPLPAALRYAVETAKLMTQKDVARIREAAPLPVGDVVIPAECREVQR